MFDHASFVYIYIDNKTYIEPAKPCTVRVLVKSGSAEVRDEGVLTCKNREINCGEKCGTTGNLREYKMPDVCRHAQNTVDLRPTFLSTIA